MFGQKKTIVENLIINGPIFLLILVGSLLAAISSQENAVVSILLTYLIGMVFFLIAKWSAIKKGSFISFGPADMDRKNRKYYFIGYALMSLSTVVGIILFTINR